MKIKSLRFFDYRAFFNGENNDYFFKIDCKNLLIYGENGSGKTSLFRGVKDFINSADFIPHFLSPRLNEGFIEIEFSDGTTDRLDGTGLKPSKVEVIKASKLNSFPTSFQRIPNGMAFATHVPFIQKPIVTTHHKKFFA